MLSSFIEAIRASDVIVTGKSSAGLLVTAALMRQRPGQLDTHVIEDEGSVRRDTEEVINWRDRTVIAVDFGMNPDELATFFSNGNRFSVVVIGSPIGNWERIETYGGTPLISDYIKIGCCPASLSLVSVCSTGDTPSTGSHFICFSPQMPRNEETREMISRNLSSPLKQWGWSCQSSFTCSA